MELPFSPMSQTGEMNGIFILGARLVIIHLYEYVQLCVRPHSYHTKLCSEEILLGTLPV